MSFGEWVRRCLLRLVLVLTVAAAAAVAANLVVVPPAGAGQASARQASGEPLRVLIVGDSVTQGSAGDFTWRYRLWAHLTAGGAAVDFVGPRDDLQDNIDGGAGSQDYADPAFDRDHAARWGQTLAFFVRDVAPIEDLVATYHPDVVIEMLGVNDLTFLTHSADRVASDMRAFVAKARSADPAVDVVLGHLSQTWYDKVPEFNALLDGLAIELDDATSRVTTAAVDTGFALQLDTWDPAHPNAQGEVLIAAAMADALAGLGLATPYPRPVPVVPLGPRQAAVVQATATDGGASLTWTGPPGADHEIVWLRDVSLHQGWTPLPDRVAAKTTTLSGLTNGHTYAVTLQPVKGYWPAADDVRSAVVRVRPLPPPPGEVVLTRAWSPRRDRVRVTARAADGATTYRLEVAPTQSCATMPVRFSRRVTGLTAPRATYPTTAPYVRVRMVAQNLAGGGPVGVSSRCLRVR